MIRQFIDFLSLEIVLVSKSALLSNNVSSRTVIDIIISQTCMVMEIIKCIHFDSASNNHNEEYYSAK